MGVYGIFAMLGAAGLMYGWAQTTVDEYPWGFWVAPVCLALAAFVYGAAVIGQGLTVGEMHQMRSFVERAAEKARGRPSRLDPAVESAVSSSGLHPLFRPGTTNGPYPKGEIPCSV